MFTKIHCRLQRNFTLHPLFSSMLSQEKISGSGALLQNQKIYTGIHYDKHTQHSTLPDPRPTFEVVYASISLN